MSTISEIQNAKQKELNLLKLAYYKCSNCGFVKAENCYFAISHLLCCNLCGNEIES